MPGQALGKECASKCHPWFVMYIICRFVCCDHFTRGILVAILVNTLSMGVEYHQQPELLTTVLEYSNFFFTALFALEMLLKIVADGFFGYLSDGFNLFDGGIVAMRYTNCVCVLLHNSFLNLQRAGTVPRRQRRPFRVANFPIAANPQTRPLHARTSLPTGCYAAHHGQCDGVFRPAFAVHLHIQAKQNNHTLIQINGTLCLSLKKHLPPI